MIRFDLESRLISAVEKLVASGFLPADGLPRMELSDARQPDHGDLACNFGLTASKAAGKPPRDIAQALLDALDADDLIETAEIAGPGFINFRFKASALDAYVPKIVALGNDLSRTPSSSSRRIDGEGAGGGEAQPWTPNTQRINVEFVSVNPNGPITVGSGRGAAFGSTLCNVLEAAGNDVHREYYINDGVNSEQMRQFARAVRYRIHSYGKFKTLADHRILRTVQFCQQVVRSIIEGSITKENVGAINEQAISSAIDRLNVPVSEMATIAFPFHDLEEVPVGSEVAKQAIIKGIVGSVNRVRDGSWQDAGRDDFDYLFGFVPYKGSNIDTLASDLSQEFGDNLRGWGLDNYQSTLQQRMVNIQRDDLEKFAVIFDTWFSEQSLHDVGQVEKDVADLIAKGAADEDLHRTVIKLGKGGKVEDVQWVSQARDDEDEDATDNVEQANLLPQTPPPTASQEEGKTLWLRSTKFGDDMDRVLRRKDGRLTYISSDISYHKDKFNRGNKTGTERATKLITVLGPDHHGYISRLHAVLAALELETQPLNESHGGEQADSPTPNPSPIDPSGSTREGNLDELDAKIWRTAEEKAACQTALAKAQKELEVVIFQIVRFVKDGKPAPMRKRDGNIYSLRDLMTEIGKNAAPNAPEEEQMRIGKDVARFFYLMRSHDTHMDFDLDLAEKQSDENPVYYVQYAHARICSVLRKAKESGIDVAGLEEELRGEGTPTPAPSPTNKLAREGLLGHPRELALIKKILDLPYEVQRCAEDYGIHRLTTFATELARAYHGFYDACRVLQPEEPELTRARLALCLATRSGLRAVFNLLGISAPEKMERDPA